MPSLIDRIKAAFTEATPEERAEFAVSPGSAAAVVAPGTPAVVALPGAASAVVTPPAVVAQPATDTPNPAMVALLSQVADLKKGQREGLAAAFVQKQVLAGKLTPAEKLAAFSAYVRALEDDEANPGLVAFTAVAGGTAVELSRAQVIEAQYAARPAHGLTTEQVSVLFAMQGGAGDPPVDQGEEGRKKGKAFVDKNYPAK